MSTTYLSMSGTCVELFFTCLKPVLNICGQVWNRSLIGLDMSEACVEICKHVWAYLEHICNYFKHVLTMS